MISFSLQMVQLILANGFKIKSMAEELKNGLVDLSMQGNIMIVRNIGKSTCNLHMIIFYAGSVKGTEIE